MTERGVSDVIGFILVFSLVISTVAVVYVSGFGGLENARDAERIGNAERAFDVMADNMADMYRTDAPSRKTALNLAGSELYIGEPTTFTVTVGDITDAGGNTIVYQANSRPLVYDAAGANTEIVYEAGAVIRTDGRNGVLLSEPPVLVTDDQVVLTYVVLSGSSEASSESVAGDSTVLVRAERQGRNVLVSDDDGSPKEVTFTVETTDTRADIWERHLESELASSANMDDWETPAYSLGDLCDVDASAAPVGRSVVTCKFEPSEAFYLSSTGIEVELAT